jgi:MFS family permease
VTERSPLLPIFLIVLVDVLGLTLILPLLPFYAEHFGATPAVVGLLVSAFAVCQLFAGPVLGKLSDRFGRKPLLVVSQAGTFAGFLLLANAWALWVVFLARVIDGITAGNLSIAQAYIADVTRPEDRAKSFGVIGVAFGLGFLMGPAVSGWLAHYDVRYPIYGAAALSATSILATLALLPKPVPVASAPEGSYRGEKAPAPPPAGPRLGVFDWGQYTQYFQREDLAGLLVRFFLFAFSFALFTGGFALFAERRFTTAAGHPFGPREVGYLLAYPALLGIFLQGGLIGRLVKRFGEPRIILTGFAALTAAYVVLAFAPTITWLMVSATLGAYGNGVLRPSITSLITQRVERSEQGVTLGLTQSLTSVSGILAPPLAGVLIDHRWLTAWALCAAVVALIGLLLPMSMQPVRRTA